MLRRLAVPYSVEEWSEERERLLLSRALVSFLPVNAQNFSVVKSLNRAVSALCAGCQVLSSGYPLYESLAPFVYRDPDRLLEIFAGARCRYARNCSCIDAPVSRGRIPSWRRDLCDSWMCSAKSSSAPGRGSSAPLSAVIHGRHGAIHKFAGRMDASVASPFALR